MRNIALVNAIDLREQALRPLVEGRSSFSLALEFGRSLPDAADAVVLLSKPVDLPAGFRPVVRPSWTVADLFDELAAAAGLLMDKDRGIPAVLGRGYPYQRGEGRSAELLRERSKDLFR